MAQILGQGCTMDYGFLKEMYSTLENLLVNSCGDKTSFEGNCEGTFCLGNVVTPYAAEGMVLHSTEMTVSLHTD